MSEETTIEDNWEQKAGEYLAGWKRAQADYANLQKEMTTQRGDMRSQALGDSVKTFLPVYDYFKRAMQHVPPVEEQTETVKAWITGTSHIATLFKMTLQQIGVEEIPTVGKLFDPNTMDAMKEVETSDVAPGVVVEEIEGGYSLNNKVIKAARVIVAAEPKQTNQ